MVMSFFGVGFADAVLPTPSGVIRHVIRPLAHRTNLTFCWENLNYEPQTIIEIALNFSLIFTIICCLDGE